jgi:CheY-like chemotaxis protein
MCVEQSFAERKEREMSQMKPLALNGSTDRGNGIDLMLQLSNDYGLRGIALTGYGMAEDLAKTEQAGFLAHLVKPINFDQLHRVLEQAQSAAG